MKTIFVFIGLLIFSSTSHAVTSASSLMVDARQLWVSTNIDCTNPVQVFNHGDTPSAMNFLEAPVLGGGEIPNGVYQCVIIRMRDRISFVPEANSGPCTAGTINELDLCREGSSTESPEGTVTGCQGTSQRMSSGGIENDVYLYLSTASGGTSNAFKRPTGVGSVNGVNLASPLVVDGIAKAKFVVDARGKVDVNGGSTCDMDPPIFKFTRVQ